MSDKDSYDKGNKKGSSGSLIDEIPFDKYEKSANFSELRKGFKEGKEYSKEDITKISQLIENTKNNMDNYQKGIVAGYSKVLLENGNENDVLRGIEFIGEAELMDNKSARQNIKKGIERGASFGDKVFLNKAKELIQYYEKKSE